MCNPDCTCSKNLAKTFLTIWYFFLQKNDFEAKFWSKNMNLVWNLENFLVITDHCIFSSTNPEHDIQPRGAIRPALCAGCDEIRHNFVRLLRRFYYTTIFKFNSMLLSTKISNSSWKDAQLKTISDRINICLQILINWWNMTLNY